MPTPEDELAEYSEELLEDELPVEETSGFMGILALGMPWVISLFFHIAVLLVLSLLVMYSILEKSEDLTKAEPVAAPEDVEIYTDTTEATEETESLRPTTERDFAPKENPSLDDSAASDVIVPIALLAEGAEGGVGFGGTGDGEGEGRGGGMYGSSGIAARNVVYVIDRSGSMQKTFGLVRKEMLDSILSLSEEQDFHVILFATGPPLEKKPARLTSAAPEFEFRGNAGVFLQGVEAAGATDPIPALKRAFAVLRGARADRPGKLIHLLTDGNFPNNQATLEAIRTLNSQGDVHINTFLYGRRPVEAEKVMRQIADENRGTYKYVSPDETY